MLHKLEREISGQARKSRTRRRCRRALKKRQRREKLALRDRD